MVKVAGPGHIAALVDYGMEVRSGEDEEAVLGTLRLGHTHVWPRCQD
jgi:hypothetical protein